MLLQIVVVGQHELRDLMRTSHLRQLAQRLGADYHIGTLDEEETTRYVRHRLLVAGGKITLFSTNAIRLVYASSRGVPCLVSQLCDTTLVYGFAEGTPKVSSAS